MSEKSESHSEPQDGFIYKFGTNPDVERSFKKFYSSNDWIEKRNYILETRSCSCVVCESTEDLVIDHVKPLRCAWELRLADDNLQIMCRICNLEKGSSDNWFIISHKILKSKRIQPCLGIWSLTQHRQISNPIKIKDFLKDTNHCTD